MSEPKLEETSEEWYCGYCGTASKKNTIKNKSVGYYVLSCNSCGIVTRFYVISSPNKTKLEALEVFSQTPLTKQQRFGSGNKPFKGRKRKND